MAANTAAKLNTEQSGGIYYVSFFSALKASALSSLAQIYSGLISSFSGKKDEQGNESTFTRKYDEITELTGISAPSISRFNRDLKALGYMHKDGQSGYIFDHGKVSGRKWHCPLEVLSREFEMTDDDGNTFAKRLTPSTCKVYALIYTKRSVYQTYKEIADELGIDPDTVAAAMDYLRWAKLIGFPKSNVARNGSQKNRIYLRKGWRWFKLEKQFRKRLRAQEPDAESAAETRELYYAGLRAKADKKAAKARNKAFKCLDYKALTAEMGSVRSMYFKARDLTEKQAFNKRLNVLDARLNEVLTGIGLSSAQLDSKYYVKCTCCNDTGYTPEGTACDCYERRRSRGSPPKRDKRTTKGIE